MALPKAENRQEEVNNVETLQKELEFSKRLNFITNKIHSSRDIDDILINLRDSILGVFDADRLTIYVLDVSNKEIVSLFDSY